VLPLPVSGTFELKKLDRWVTLGKKHLIQRGIWVFVHAKIFVLTVKVNLVFYSSLKGTINHLNKIITR